MTRIATVNPASTDVVISSTLNAIKAKLGVIPNIFLTLANSKVALKSYMQLTEVIGQGLLTERQREMIAIVVAQENTSQYCLSAHAAIGKSVGLTSDDIERAQHGGAITELDDNILSFALQVARNKGHVSEDYLSMARSNGLTDEMMLEITTNVIINLMTNYINNLAETSIDFPLTALNNVA